MASSQFQSSVFQSFSLIWHTQKMPLFACDAGVHGRGCSLPEVTGLAIPGPSSPVGLRVRSPHTCSPFSRSSSLKGNVQVPLTEHSLPNPPSLLPLHRHTHCSGCAGLVVYTYCPAVSPPLWWCSRYLFCPLFPQLADSGLPSRCYIDCT